MEKRYYYLSNTLTYMQSAVKVTSKGQVTIPREIREKLGIRPAESEVEFVLEENGRCYLKKIRKRSAQDSRFRRAHKAGRIRMSTEELMALTRGE